jgi:hypothetical protein
MRRSGTYGSFLKRGRGQKGVRRGGVKGGQARVDKESGAGCLGSATSSHMRGARVIIRGMYF